MAASKYLLLLLLALVAGTVVVSAMGRDPTEYQVSGSDPRRPRPPPPAPPRPRPPPPPPQPSPAPPAGPQAPAAQLPAIPVPRELQECVLDVDPDTQEVGISGTGASRSSTPTVSVGEIDRNGEGKLPNRRTGTPHIAKDAKIKRTKVKAKGQQTTDAQDMRNASSVKGSTLKFSGLDYDDIVGLVVKISVKKTSDDSKHTFSTKSEGRTEPNIAKKQDRQRSHAESHDQEVPEMDSKSDGSIEDCDTDNLLDFNNGSKIYIDANWKLYRSIEDLEVVALVRKNGEVVEKSQNTQILRTAPSTRTVQSSHSGIPSPPDDINPPAVHPFSPVECVTIKRTEHTLLESVATLRNCTFMRTNRLYTRSLTFCTSEHPGNFVCQGGALQRSASHSKGPEQNLLSHMQQQMMKSHTVLAARRREQVISWRLPSQTPGGSASAPPPLNAAGSSRYAQSEATCVLTEKPYRKLQNKKPDTVTQRGVQPEQKWWNTGSFMTSTPSGADKSPHSVKPPLYAAGNAKGTLHRRVDVLGAANQGEKSISVKEGSAPRDCDVPIEHTLKFGSFTLGDPVYSIIHSNATQTAVAMPTPGKQQHLAHLAQQQNKPAPQTRRAANAAPSPAGKVCGKRNKQSGTAFTNTQQRKPDLQVGHQNGQLQQNHVLAPVVVVTVPDNILLSSPCVVSCCPSALNSSVGYLANQQTAAVGSTLQNPSQGNSTAGSPPAHQESACIGTSGNSRNRQDAAVQTDIRRLSTLRRNRPHEGSTRRHSARRQRGAASQAGHEAESAPEAGGQPGSTDAHPHM